MQSRNFGASLKTALQAVSLVALVVGLFMPAAEANGYNKLPRTQMARMAYAPSVGSRNGLPACTMDSFVANAYKAGRAEAIYGDEGVGEAPPPYKGFTAAHRINAGIVGAQDAGLTTGHGSSLPSAWGRDEKIGGQEWMQSGYNGNAYSTVSTPNIVASGDMPPTAPSFKAGSSDYDMSGITGSAPVSGGSQFAY